MSFRFLSNSSTSTYFNLWERIFQRTKYSHLHRKLCAFPHPVFFRKLTKELQMTVHLPLPGHKVHSRTYPLYGPILPLLSTFSILSTKCEIILSKADARSWPSFKALDEEIVRGNFVSQLAFTSGGGRGTMGSREAVLDGRNGGV